MTKFANCSFLSPSSDSEDSIGIGIQADIILFPSNQNENKKISLGICFISTALLLYP